MVAKGWHNRITGTSLAAVAVITVGLGLVGFSRGQQSAPTRWEYLTLKAHDDTTTLNRLGRDGWELVTVTTAIINGNAPGAPGDLFFKRPLP